MKFNLLNKNPYRAKLSIMNTIKKKLGSLGSFKLSSNLVKSKKIFGSSVKRKPTTKESYRIIENIGYYMRWNGKKVEEDRKSVV